MHLHTALSFTSANADSVLAAWLGSDVRCKSIQPLKGGMLNTVLQLTFDREPYTAVIKLNMAEHHFGAEAQMLRHLSEQSRFPCPKVYVEDRSGRNVPYAYLLMERLPGVNMWNLDLRPEDRRRIDRQLAEVLLELHSHTRKGFGALSEHPGQDRWSDVFLPKLHEVRRQPEINGRLTPDVLCHVDAAISRAEEALCDQGRPTLVHGDVWAANILVEHGEEGWRLSGLVDPAAQYADVEMELAYLEEFSCVIGPAFFEAYEPRAPLRRGYHFRRLFYWLYSYLVHVWLFEDRHYRDKTASVARQIDRQETPTLLS